MSFSNQEYLYDHLPSRFRTADQPDLLLKRFLQHFGATLDTWDAAFDAFDASITPATATAQWVGFWLLELFGWSWFPWWFSLADKRTLYGHFARHLGRRGTRHGIELWLLDFGIVARVHTRQQPWSEFVWGETVFAITQPLHLIVEILSVKSFERDIGIYGDGFWGEFPFTEPRPLFTDREIIDLVRYQQPQAQEITIAWRTREMHSPRFEDDVNWAQISW